MIVIVHQYKKMQDSIFGDPQDEQNLWQTFYMIACYIDNKQEFKALVQEFKGIMQSKFCVNNVPLNDCPTLAEIFDQMPRFQQRSSKENDTNNFSSFDPWAMLSYKKISML